jgi:hypothetical protein
MLIVEKKIVSFADAGTGTEEENEMLEVWGWRSNLDRLSRQLTIHQVHTNEV